MFAVAMRRSAASAEKVRRGVEGGHGITQSGQASGVAAESARGVENATRRCQQHLPESSDAAKRVQLVWQAQELLAEEVPVLPLSPVLDIVVFNSTKVAGR